MSDTRNHTTRDQLAEALCPPHHREGSASMLTKADGTTESKVGPRRPCTYHAAQADALLASDAIAAVRAAAVAETTAAIEAVLNPEGHPNARDYGRAAVWSDDVRAALSGGRTALDTTLAQAWDLGYACGLGDYGKSDDETHNANPWRVK